MKFKSVYFLLLVLCLSASVSFAMSNKPKLPEKKWNPAIKDIKLGSQYDDVISQFGEPRSKKENLDSIVMTYEGLNIEIDSTDKKSLWVSRIEIISQKWEINPDIKIGMHKNDIKKILGSFLHEEKRDGQVLIWWWHGNPRFDSLFLVVFEEDKAIRIVFAQDKSL